MYSCAFSLRHSALEVICILCGGWGKKTIILASYLFGQPCLFGQYENDVMGEPAHVLIPSNFTPQYFKSQQIKENAKE